MPPVADRETGHSHAPGLGVLQAGSVGFSHVSW